MDVVPDVAELPAETGLPESALEGLGRRPFGVYVHVPFCASRCGYCDFNTYTASELGGGVSRDGYADLVLQELGQAGRIVEPRQVDTVFVGGGTPTLLSAADLGRVLEG